CARDVYGTGFDFW
nr:immunoglobulin heavy chain junction region [Macaca mulatta]MOW81975.1 immunoglobulin heavy chain junction region [Macaca mulatta]